VAILGIMAFEKLDDFLRAFQREMRHLDEGTGTRRLTLPLSQVLLPSPTDKDGRFEIKGVGGERLMGIEVASAAFAKGTIAVVTRAGLDVKALTKDRPARGGERAELLFGPTFEHVVEPTRGIEGTVREADTGKPVAGATVRVQGSTGVTDAQGHYQLTGIGKARELQIEVTAPRDLPLIGKWQRMANAPGLEPIHCDIELTRGVIVKGRVFDKATGKGVQSSVHFIALPENKFAQKAAGLALYASTDAEGRFHLVTIPGPGVLLAGVAGTVLKIDGIPIYPYKQAEFDAADRARVKLTDTMKPYRGFVAAGGGIEMLDVSNACKVVDLKEGDQEVTCDLMLDPGKTLTVKVQDADGKPLSGALAAGVSAGTIRAVPLKSDTCPVYALDPEKPREMIFLHPDRKLAALLTVRGDEKEPVTVRLAPTATIKGRALDSDGQPIAGSEVFIHYPTPLGQQLSKMSALRTLPQTDKEGHFTAEGIVPGLKVDIGFRKGPKLHVPVDKLDIKWQNEAGKTIDLGEIKTKPRE
jgi:hypothetical protein